jgi:bis(5'-nucleosyl)-tetraphosphatase (symmetrical)
MAVYAIGDVQGCYDELQALLERIGFMPSRDHLWFTGDLVNRGPQSLEVLGLVKGLGTRAISVLGNHDLHLLAVCYAAQPLRTQDTFMEVLTSPDRDEIVDWLRHRPLLHHDDSNGYTLIHAGLPPQWDLGIARACAAEVEAALRQPDPTGFFAHLYDNEPSRWSIHLSSQERLRFTTNCLTRMRYCDPLGTLNFQHTGPIGSQPPQFLPWFQIPDRASRGMRILFGHWAALGAGEEAGVYALDSGCIWGGQLTALRLEDRRWFNVPCHR